MKKYTHGPEYYSVRILQATGLILLAIGTCMIDSIDMFFPVMLLILGALIFGVTCLSRYSIMEDLGDEEDFFNL